MSAASSSVLASFANLKLWGDRCVRDAILALQAQDPNISTSSAMRSLFVAQTNNHLRKKKRLRKLYHLSDKELEIELNLRRERKARERERYARAMRADKLALLETELDRLKLHMAGTHQQQQQQKPVHVTNSSQSSLHSPNHSLDKQDFQPLDLEKLAKDKLERQRRRQLKRKERTMIKKKLTIVDVVRSAGPHPISRLKPSGSIQLAPNSTHTNSTPLNIPRNLSSSPTKSSQPSSSQSIPTNLPSTNPNIHPTSTAPITSSQSLTTVERAELPDNKNIHTTTINSTTTPPSSMQLDPRDARRKAMAEKRRLRRAAREAKANSAATTTTNTDLSHAINLPNSSKLD